MASPLHFLKKMRLKKLIEAERIIIGCDEDFGEGNHISTDLIPHRDNLMRKTGVGLDDMARIRFRLKSQQGV